MKNFRDIGDVFCNAANVIQELFEGTDYVVSASEFSGLHYFEVDHISERINIVTKCVEECRMLNVELIKTYIDLLKIGVGVYENRIK